MNKLLLAAAGAALVASTPAMAAQVFFADFENVPGAPGAGGYTIVTTADGFTGSNGIELQNNVAGSPAPNGGNVFVELDTSGNTDMSRAIGAGSYVLSFLYSPRPGVGADSNGLSVQVGGSEIFAAALAGGSNTAFQTYTVNFTAAAPTTLSFVGTGTSDGVGAYVDNISLTSVPEPATWALMIAGFGLVGGAMRRRAAAGVRFA